MTGFAADRHALAGCALRPLDAADHAALARSLAVMEPWAGLGYGIDALERYLARPDPALTRFAISRGDDPLAGLLAVRHPWLRGPYIEMLAVLPAHQGHGLGRAVMDWCQGQAARIADNLWVCVSDFNAPARAFYASMGFDQAASLDGLVAPGSAELLLRKRLG